MKKGSTNEGIFNSINYFRESLNKYEYIRDGLSSNWIHGYVPARMYMRNGIPDIVEICRKKFDDQYLLHRDFLYYDGKECIGESRNRQHIYIYPKKKKQYSYHPWYWNREEMDWDEFNYILKTIRLCKNNEVKIILLTMPTYPSEIKKFDYDEFHSLVSELADEEGVPYYDFNLAFSEWLDIGENDWYDNFHLNGKGAEKCTHALLSVLQQEERNCFYKSLQDKLEEE